MFEFVKVTDLRVNQRISVEVAPGRDETARVQSVDLDGNTVWVKHTWNKDREPHGLNDCVVVVG